MGQINCEKNWNIGVNKIIRSLKKGSSVVYFEYPDVGDSIYADRFEVKLNNDVAKLCFRLKPSDDNQKDDEEHLNEYRLKSVTIDDECIIKKLCNFLKNKSASSMQLEIISQGETLKFNVDIDTHDMNTLKLLIV